MEGIIIVQSHRRMKRRAGRFSVVDHRENARTHISHLFLDPVPIARGADPHDGHPRKCASFILAYTNSQQSSASKCIILQSS